MRASSANVTDCLVVGFKGDLIMGTANGSAIGTLVERSTRTVVLVHLPYGRTATATCDALAGVFASLPAGLRRSLTWDQGKELSLRGHSPLQRLGDSSVRITGRSRLIRRPTTWRFPRSAARE